MDYNLPWMFYFMHASMHYFLRDNVVEYTWQDMAATDCFSLLTCCS